MSEDQNDIKTSDDAESVVADSRSPLQIVRGNSVAWLALLVAAGALTLVGYSVFEDWRTADDSTEFASLASIDNLRQRADRTDAALAGLRSDIDQITHPDYSADIAAVRRDVEERIALLDSLPSRVATIESSVASLAGISVGARETFLLAEAEFYLQIANAQLQLANNPHLASLALGMADERVAQLSDPGLGTVRRSISDELAALEVMDKPDLEGATLTLASLARVVESLPLATEAQGEERVDVDAARSSAARAWDAVKAAMSGLVRVTPPGAAERALVTPDAGYLLRNNIALQLQAARLALLRGEQTIFEQTLDDIRESLDRYFDADSEQVRSAQLTLREIREEVFTTSVPDISESLRLLRRFRSLRETAE